MVSYTTTPDYFNSAADVLAVDDCIEFDVGVEGWDKHLRIRSLTVPQREKINRAAGVGDKRDWVEFHAHTIAYGVVRPRFTVEAARSLVEQHNGELVEQLSEAIWAVGSLRKTYQLYLEELKQRNDAKDQLPPSD